MTRLEDLPRAGADGAVLAGDDLALTATGEARRPGGRVSLVKLDAAAGGGYPSSLIAIDGETPLRALIDARLRHPGPFVVRQGEAVVGVVRDEDLFRCLVHTRPALQDPAEPA
jgi:hypothetical protein